MARVRDGSIEAFASTCSSISSIGDEPIDLMRQERDLTGNSNNVNPDKSCRKPRMRMLRTPPCRLRSGLGEGSRRRKRHHVQVSRRPPTRVSGGPIPMMGSTGVRVTDSAIVPARAIVWTQRNQTTISATTWATIYLTSTPWNRTSLTITRRLR
jgi:hypothetical protein